MLLLCCIDGSITIHDQIKGTNNSIKAAFVRKIISVLILKIIVINIKNQILMTFI
jgi:hypothetical protein